tara:strand:+ start:132 stop:692 length:561 start_codon:yes stop_codon:yes gene_type:complete
MASILKVDKIRGTGLDSDTISLDGTGNITIPKNVTFSGTTTGASFAGTDAFCANGNTEAWASAAGDTIVWFPNDSNHDNFDTGNRFDTSTYKYSARADGVYLFWYSIYTAENDTGNSFGFMKNSTKIRMQNSSAGIFTFQTNSADDHIQNGTIIIHLSANDTMAVITTSQSDYYRGHSQFGGCRLA